MRPVPVPRSTRRSTTRPSTAARMAAPRPFRGHAGTAIRPSSAPPWRNTRRPAPAAHGAPPRTRSPARAASSLSSRARPPAPDGRRGAIGEAVIGPGAFGVTRHDHMARSSAVAIPAAALWPRISVRSFTECSPSARGASRRRRVASPAARNACRQCAPVSHSILRDIKISLSVDCQALAQASAPCGGRPRTAGWPLQL